MWGVDSDGGDWPFFVKAPEFSRKDVIASIPSLVPRIYFYARPVKCISTENEDYNPIYTYVLVDV